MIQYFVASFYQTTRGHIAQRWSQNGLLKNKKIEINNKIHFEKWVPRFINTQKTSFSVT